MAYIVEPIPVNHIAMHPVKSGHINPDLASEMTVSSPRIRAQEMATTTFSNVSDAIELINEQEKSNFRLGVVFLVIAIVSWLTGLELVNAVLKGDDYHKPLFLSFVTGLCFLLNLLPEFFKTSWWVISLCLGTIKRQPGRALQSDSPLLSFSDLNTTDDVSCKNLLEPPHGVAVPLTRKEVLSLAAQIAIVYFAYNTFVMMALQYTSASNQTILGSTTAMFTLFMGVALGIDKFTSKKVICVATSLIGVVLISLGEKHASGSTDNKFAPKNPGLGNLLALLGAFAYGLYLIVMKVQCGMGNKTTDERILFGWVGAFTFVLGLPLLYIAHALDIEKFELPNNKAALIMISVNAVLSVVSDYFTILAMLLTSPLVTSLALTSSIPITILADFIILQLTGHKKTSPSSGVYVYAFGVFCILVSVVMINLNINTENELIEEVIEETLEGAVKLDEVLSPILSPYLEHSQSSPGLLGHDIGIAPLSPQFNLTRRRNIHRPSPLAREVSGLSLSFDGESSQRAPLKNSNHLLNLYTIDSAIRSNNELQNEPSEGGNLVLYGGVNHNFVIRTADPASSKSPDVLHDLE